METNNQNNISRGRLRGVQNSRLKKLLYMKYSPRELADEIGFDARQVYDVYLPLGCPHERDSKRHIWIVGSQFREWYKGMYQKKKLSKNEAYCVSCKRVISISNPVEHIKEELVYLLCDCPQCNQSVAKILATRSNTND